MGFRCGIVGLPNVGKSTIFNALTAAAIDAANYPFCTIEPNVGIVPVPDERLDRLADLVHTRSKVPTQMEFVDIAGLVRGASRGEGLGNQFLGHIRQVDAIVHVIRCFEDENIVHVDGSVDPLRDREVINTELILADLDTVDRRLQKTRNQAKSGDSKVIAQVAFLEQVRDILDSGQPARSVAAGDRTRRDLLRELCLLTAKPVLYVANVHEDDLAGGNSFVDLLREAAAAEQSPVVVIAGSIEQELSRLSREEQAEFLTEHLLHRRGKGNQGLDHSARHQGTGGGRQNPLRFRTGVHPGRGHCLRGLYCLRQRSTGQGEGPHAVGRQGLRRPRWGLHSVPF